MKSCNCTQPVFGVMMTFHLVTSLVKFMDYKLHAESGCQLLARLAPRPSLVGLDKEIMTLYPDQSTLIEVKGLAGSGKTMLLLKWAAQAVLSKTYGGLGAGVLFIDSDMHFSIFTFHNLLEALVLQYSDKLSVSVREAAIKAALEQLTVISVCDGFQLKATLLTLDKLLLDSPHISLILLDSLPAFYWSDRLSGGECFKDKYQQKILNLIHQKTYQHKITLAFTKNSDFQSQSGFSVRNSPGINIQIELQQVEDKFSALVTTLKRNQSFSYTINHGGLVWTK